MNLINATHLNLINTGQWATICYANCPLWHGCDCPNHLPR